MNILLIGECYSCNLGDGVLCGVTKNYLEEHIEKLSVDMLDMSLRNKFSAQDKQLFNANRYKKTYCKKKICDMLAYAGIDIREKRRRKEVELLKTVLEECITKNRPQAIVFAGGQLLNETFISRIEMIVSYAEKEKIPVIFNACGCGLHLPRIYRNRIKNIFNTTCVKYISVRDGHMLIQSLTKKNVINTADTALLTSNYYNNSKKKDVIGIGLMVSKNQNITKQINFWKEILISIDSNGYNFEVFCNGDPQDYAFAEYLLNTTGLYREDRIAACPITPEELISTISKYSSIISMRLHSLIVAYSYEIPAIAISWDRKVKEFYHKLENDEYCFTMNDDIQDILESAKKIVDDSSYFDQKNKNSLLVQNNMNNIVKLLKNNTLGGDDQWRERVS